MSRVTTADAQRHALQIACRRANLSLDQLWLAYFTLGGEAEPVEVEAFLQGLMPLPAVQRDILTHAVNERLDDLTTRLRVPYERLLRSATPSVGPLGALVRLLEGMEQEPPERIVDVMRGPWTSR